MDRSSPPVAQGLRHSPSRPLAIGGMVLVAVTAALWARWARREPELDERTRRRLRG